MAIDVVLVEPEIPQNTGNIARTCVATGSRLHLVEPLGFSIDDKQLKRAGLDYWFDLDVTIWNNLDEIMAWTLEKAMHEKAQVYFCSTKSSQSYVDVVYPEHAVLFFGKESRGLPEPLLSSCKERCIRIPMLPGKRSLNLSNAVAVVLYEVLRQQNFPGFQLTGQLTSLGLS